MSTDSIIPAPAFPLVSVTQPVSGPKVGFATEKEERQARERLAIIEPLLNDIRDELQALNRLLGCHNFLRLPGVLDEINCNTKKPKYVRKAKP